MTTVREYAGKFDFLFVLHRLLDKVAQARAEIQGSSSSELFSISVSGILEFANGVESICMILPSQLRSESGCMAGVKALWAIRHLGLNYEDYTECRDTLEKEKELRSLIARLEKTVREEKDYPLYTYDSLTRKEVEVDPFELAETNPAAALSVAKKKLNNREFRMEVEDCKYLIEKYTNTIKQVEKLLEEAGIKPTNFTGSENPYTMIVEVADTLVQRIVDVLDAHQLLIPGRRIAVGVLKGEASGAGQVGVEE